MFHMDSSKSSKVTFLWVPSRAENKLCGESFKGSGKFFVVTSIRYQEVGSPHYQTLPLGADGEGGGGGAFSHLLRLIAQRCEVKTKLCCCCCSIFPPPSLTVFVFQRKGTVHSKLTYLLFTATTGPFCSCAEEKNFLWWEDAWHVTMSETRKKTKRKQSAVVTDEPNSLWELLSHRRGKNGRELPPTSAHGVGKLHL